MCCFSKLVHLSYYKKSNSQNTHAHTHTGAHTHTHSVILFCSIPEYVVAIDACFILLWQNTCAVTCLEKFMKSVSRISLRFQEIQFAQSGNMGQALAAVETMKK